MAESSLQRTLNGSASDSAKRLLGCILERTVLGKTVRVRIVETEAYDESDIASHSFKGKTERTKVMFEEAGHLYVYFTYGMHYCCNIVVGPKGHGAAVLIRAVEPLSGDEVLQLNRHATGVNLTNGPAKLCQALDIDKRLNGHYLESSPLCLLVQPCILSNLITTTTRIGIRHGTDVSWRFYITDNPYVSVRAKN